MKSPVYEVIVGEAIPDLALWIFTNNVLLAGADYSYSLVVRDPDDLSDLFQKTSGFVGQTGTGSEHDRDGVPNLIVRWGQFGELDLLTPGRSHKASLQYTRLSDGKPGYFPLVIRATAQTG
jgi:hypothetical protein